MKRDLELSHLDRYGTILDILEVRAVVSPDETAFLFLDYKRDEQIETFITYGDLVSKAKKIAGYLQKAGYQGKRAVLLYPDGIAFIIALIGCLYAGCIAVPLYHFRTRRKAERLLAIIRDSDACLLMTDSKNMDKLQGFLEPVLENDHQWAASDLICSTPEEYPSFVPAYQREDLAYLQYTSGSTSVPKGVMITHGNIMHNMKVIQHNYESKKQSKGVSWIPHYHDMGLIYTIFQPLYIGYLQILMQPADFIGKPFRFFKAISDNRGTTFAMPNFGFDYSTKTITEDEVKELDLSCVVNAANGSEPIQTSTMLEFYHHFKACGLKQSALMPGYGLAEATLVVTSGSRDAKGNRLTSVDINSAAFKKNEVVPAESEDFSTNCCSSGGIRDHVSVKIVDPDTCEECKERRVGEIWTSSESVSPGYWNKPDWNEKIFRAYTSDKREGPFLRTGDMGFIYENNLYICGRRKDVLIIRGANYYPNDIEHAVVDSNECFRENDCVAFTMDGGNQESLYLGIEWNRKAKEELDPYQTMKGIRRLVSETFGLTVKGILMFHSGSIPKTSSGKIQRSLCKERYLENSLRVLFSDIQ